MKRKRRAKRAEKNKVLGQILRASGMSKSNIKIKAQNISVATDTRWVNDVTNWTPSISKLSSLKVTPQLMVSTKSSILCEL